MVEQMSTPHMSRLILFADHARRSWAAEMSAGVADKPEQQPTPKCRKDDHEKGQRQLLLMLRCFDEALGGQSTWYTSTILTLRGICLPACLRLVACLPGYVAICQTKFEASFQTQYDLVKYSSIYKRMQKLKSLVTEYASRGCPR